MDRLWTPWRYHYITGQGTGRKGVPEALDAWPGEDTGCVFCNLLAAVNWAKADGMAAEQADEAGLIVTMRRECFVCLNRFPYSNGHMMILPYVHTASLAAVPRSTAEEMIGVAQEAEGWLRKLYRPDGLNMGINMGEAAGAGVAGHLHLHALPRWVGDSSFMTTVGETRVLPELLQETWRRLRDDNDLPGNAQHSADI